MEEQLPPGLVPVTDPNIIAQLEQPQTQINAGEGGGGRGPTREGEDKANAFLIRALGANRSYEKTGVGPRSLVGQAFADSFPNVLNTLPAAIGNSSNRQVADTTQDEFIAASLRQDSGAAIPADEMERQRRIYFPMPGDSPEVIEAKRQARVRAIQGLVASAGRAVSPDLIAQYPEYFGGEQKPDQAPKQSQMLPGAVISRDGSSNAPDPAVLAYVQKAQALFDKGGTRADFDILAAQEGWEPYGPDLDTALQNRDTKGWKAVINPPEGKRTGPSVLGALAASPLGAFVTGSANAVTAGTLDEIVGLTGGDAERAQQAKDAMRADSPIASFLGESAGGALGLAGVSRIPALASRALATDVGFSAAYGAGENNDNRLSGAAIGGAAGAIGNRLADRISRGLRGNAVVSPERQAGMDTAAAAKRLGFEVMPADVGGATTRRLSKAAEQGPLSAQPLIAAGRRVLTKAQDARDRIAASVGKALEAEAAGEAARDGAKAFIKRTAARGGELYTKARELSAGVEMPLTNALEVVQRNVAELQGVPGGNDALQVMEGLAGELGGEWSADGIRSMRTTLRDRFIGEGLRGSDIERRVNQVIDAASKDIEDGLTAAGRPGAAQAYRAADRYWRARVNTIDNELAPIIGKNGDKPGEQIIASLEQAARGNNARLASFVRSLPQDEQSTVRATIISRLGKAPDGAQNAAGNEFSLAQFLTHWNRMTPGAKRTLFDDESRAALSDLARVAQGTKEAQRYSNFSNTGGAWMGQSTAPFAAGMVVGYPAVAVGLAAQYFTGRMLASPRLTRFLARPSKSPAQVRPWIDRLERIAKAEPVIATEALGLQQQLIRAFGESTPARIAAEERRDERGGVSVGRQQNEQRGVQERSR